MPSVAVETYLLSKCSNTTEVTPPTHDYFRSDLWDVTANVIHRQGLVYSETSDHTIVYKAVFTGLNPAHEYRHAFFKQGGIIGEWSERFTAPDVVSGIYVEPCTFNTYLPLIKK